MDSQNGAVISSVPMTAAQREEVAKDKLRVMSHAASDAISLMRIICGSMLGARSRISFLVELLAPEDGPKDLPPSTPIVTGDHTPEEMANLSLLLLEGQKAGTASKI
jgi:hypothetical protein